MKEICGGKLTQVSLNLSHVTSPRGLIFCVNLARLVKHTLRASMRVFLNDEHLRK